MTTIITKNGSGAPAAEDLTAGELAVDLTNKRLYTKDSGGTVLEVGTNPSALQLNAVAETVYSISTTNLNVDPNNGTIQQWTLTGNATPTFSISNGQSVTLMIGDGANYTITWPSTMFWVGSEEPTLDTTKVNVIVVWAANSVLYGATVGVAGLV